MSTPIVHEHEGRDDQDPVEDRQHQLPRRQGPGLPGVGHGGDARDAVEERAVEVARLGAGQHDGVDDVLGVGVGQVGVAVARPGVQVDLAVPQRGVHVEQDHEAVVDVLPPDAPGVHDLRGGVLGLGGVH